MAWYPSGAALLSCHECALMKVESRPGMTLECLLFYILATANVISGLALTCESAYSWRLYSATSLEHQAASTMTCYPTQSDYPDTGLTSPFPILTMQAAWLGNNRCQFVSHYFTQPGFELNGSECPISQNRRRTLYTFGHPLWSMTLEVART